MAGDRVPPHLAEKMPNQEPSAKEKAGTLIEQILASTYSPNPGINLPIQQTLHNAQDLQTARLFVRERDIAQVIEIIAKSRDILEHFVAVYKQLQRPQQIPRADGSTSNGLILFYNEDCGGIAYFYDHQDGDKIKYRQLNANQVRQARFSHIQGSGSG